MSASEPHPYVPTPDDLDQLCARIAWTGYSSEAVEIIEEWTREHWGVESAFTTKARAEDASNAQTERSAGRVGAGGGPVTIGSKLVSANGADVPQCDGPVVDELAVTGFDPLERARELIETIHAASDELAALYGSLYHKSRADR